MLVRVNPHVFNMLAPHISVPAILLFVLSDLRSTLTYQPHELLFGTSGRRGRVVDLTQLEIYINVAGELAYLQSLPVFTLSLRSRIRN